MDEARDRRISEIERLDAVGVDTRNRSKNISWKEIKVMSRERFLASNDWVDLKEAVEFLHNSFVSLHGRIEAGEVILRHIEPSSQHRSSPIQIGYTYPELEMFVRHSNQSKNVKQIQKDFEYFTELRCKYPHRAGCAREYVLAAAAGKISLAPLNLIDFSEVKSLPTWWDYGMESCADLSKRYGSQWELIYSGESSCLLLYGSVALVKIRYFDSWGSKSFYCSKARQAKSSCADINQILDALNKLKPLNVILDVQNNRGGTDN